MNPRWRIGVLVVVALVQLAVPVTMICQHQALLRTGRAYKFRTRPVDPADAFRGRYVRLAFEQDHAPWRAPDAVQYGMELFAQVVEGADGFAVIGEVAPVRPTQGDYLKVATAWHEWGTKAGSVHFTLPFDRYYLAEGKAPQAEKIYREHNARHLTNANTYVVVRIKDGAAALAELYVADKPIQDYFASRKP